MIQINNIRKKYGSSVILHGMTLRLEKSKAYGIVGENGAGKSTLFRCLAGLEHYQGNVIMEEHCRIGYLPDTPSVQQAVSSSVEQLSVEILFGNEKASDAHGTDDAEV